MKVGQFDIINFNTELCFTVASRLKKIRGIKARFYFL